ncbi:MAG TPA: VCBS repeat-containing protein, partial [Terriglobales bacterium]|nr:VCBS repeat-containing protein [Terriglobales bacterium]
RETEIEILLGNGDGTFRLRTISIPQDFGCGFGPPILVTDFNADGKADLAYCERDQNNGKIWVLLGNGDGTFKKPVSYPIKNGLYSFSFAAGDFNSDGNTDLVVSYITFNSSVFELLLGKGDGTFQKPKSVNLHAVYNAEEGIVVGDFNSDGLLDFIFQQPGDVSVFTQK